MTACTWWVLSVFLVPCGRLRLCQLQLVGVMAPIKRVNVPMLPPDACQAIHQEGPGVKSTAGALSLMPSTT